MKTTIHFTKWDPTGRTFRTIKTRRMRLSDAPDWCRILETDDGFAVFASVDGRIAGDGDGLYPPPITSAYERQCAASGEIE